MPPKKRDKEPDGQKAPRMDQIQADHELFLQAFESEYPFFFASPHLARSFGSPFDRRFFNAESGLVPRQLMNIFHTQLRCCFRKIQHNPHSLENRRAPRRASGHLPPTSVRRSRADTCHNFATRHFFIVSSTRSRIFTGEMCVLDEHSGSIDIIVPARRKQRGCDARRTAAVERKLFL